MNNRELYDEIFAHVFTVDKSELGEDFVFGKVDAKGGTYFVIGRTR